MTFLNWKTLYNLSLPGNNLRHANDTTLMAESKEELKSLLMRVKEKSEKAGLKLNIQKIKTMASSPITLWQIQKKKVETVIDFLFLGSNITAVSDCSHEIIRCMLLGRKAAGSQCEEPRPWQRSRGRRLSICKGGIEPQGSPWKFSSIYPQNQSLPALLCYVFYLLFWHDRRAVPYHLPLRS